ncbi:hypothetical protein TcG_11806 [Trypanosoma cruzi]|nr:hypothetical protein TcG_11806 [Trypanosoma cruzi]
MARKTAELCPQINGIRSQACLSVEKMGQECPQRDNSAECRVEQRTAHGTQIFDCLVPGKVQPNWPGLSRSLAMAHSKKRLTVLRGLEKAPTCVLRLHENVDGLHVSMQVTADRRIIGDAA